MRSSSALRFRPANSPCIGPPLGWRGWRRSLGGSGAGRRWQYLGIAVVLAALLVFAMRKLQHFKIAEVRLAILHLMVGLPCSGKTTYARQLARESNALVLTLD